MATKEYELKMCVCVQLNKLMNFFRERRVDVGGTLVP